MTCVLAMVLLVVQMTGQPEFTTGGARDEPPRSVTTKEMKRWWEVYDDAMRAVDREDWSTALTALQQAVSGNSHSSAHARTYGMRFIEYFPYYYLGLTYYKLGNMPKALDYLNREKKNSAAQERASVSQEIEFYLSAATRVVQEQQRVAALSRSKQESASAPAPRPAPPTQSQTSSSVAVPEPASQPPDIIITKPPQGAKLPEQLIHVYGDVLDTYGVTEITLEVNGQSGPLHIRQNAGRIEIAPRPAPGGQQAASLGRFLNFSADVALALGETRIVVRARNIKGQSVTATRTVNRVNTR